MLNGTDLEKILGAKVDVAFVWDDGSDVRDGGDSGMSEREESEKRGDEEELERENHFGWE